MAPNTASNSEPSLRSRVNSKTGSASKGAATKKKTNGSLAPPGINGVKGAKSSNAVLTPRSRSPVGLIPLHQNYRHFIHKYEVPRKILHVSIGFLTLALYLRGANVASVTPVLIFLLLAILLLDVVRFKSPAFSKYYIKFFGFLMRESEVNQWNGIVFYLAGLIIVFLFFSKDISLLAVLLLSWCDTAASSFGRAYGHLTPKFFKNKSLAGTGAAFLTGVFAAYLLYGIILPNTSYLNVNSHLAWTPASSSLSLTSLCVLSGLSGAAAEAVDLWGLDDNLTIPVISAIVMQLAVLFCKK
ncbi:hypothetical protein V1512DRAFT_260144 [Lipomyces arxii]|uniref:uncharacterized protein n=1 Tax=Lipomyces arxii TaxID=56418 RepID=UPI0034CD20D7